MNKTHVYVADATVLRDPARFEAAYRTVDETRRQKVDHLRFAEDKRRSLAVALLLRAALQLHGVSHYRILYAEHGKPYLESNPVCISLSHSGDLVLCAVSPHEVGCDIERLGKPRLEIARRCFHPLEYDALNRCEADERVRLFYRLWTRKESAVKMTGRGLAEGLSTFAVPSSDEDRLTLETILSRPCHLRDYTLNGYHAAVCSGNPAAELVWLTLDI